MEEVINEEINDQLKSNLEKNVKNEKNSNGPIIKSNNGNVNGVKIGYLCSRDNIEENKKIVEAIISNGMNREVEFVNGDGGCYFNTSGGEYELASGEPKINLQSYYLSTFLVLWKNSFCPLCDCNIWVVDENCGEELLKKLEQTLEGEIPYLIFVKRNKDGSGFVDTANYTVEADGVVSAIANFVSICDEYIEENKSTYEKHKGKILGSLFSLLTLEELWRNGVFSGKKNNEKQKKLPKNAPVSEKKNNSAAT